MCFFQMGLAECIGTVDESENEANLFVPSVKQHQRLVFTHLKQGSPTIHEVCHIWAGMAEPASTKSFQKDKLWQYRSANMYVSFGAFFLNDSKITGDKMHHSFGIGSLNDSFRKDLSQIKM